MQKGFTLIELVVVIIILGILAVVAVPKFINISDDAHRSVIKATAGTLKSSALMTHAMWLVHGNGQAVENLSGLHDGNSDFSQYGFMTNAIDNANVDTGAVGVPELVTSQQCGRVWNVLLNHQPALDDSGNNSDGYFSVKQGIFKVSSPTGDTTTADSCEFTFVDNEAYKITYNIRGQVGIIGLN